ncbi:MAG: epoxide hydrolase domain-like protein phosphatase [Candidatus Gottesmanbacteria bacterium GW2011_GWB1_43_11]|uniref:Epoxide hydrolase domain-like protein phosphatase n=1 Tax=Candidatus Gottesmanbacteria bacterium GW2011_GWB1_43_11 TaxID=1618446 RepID=A0A0G1CNG9_9BACT|nr:MAG: epoxide hydrolase domain-like protein phosphatase [Candidatus Gottesmanbacteria bacterium GW2011_GWA2_42_16]KKS87047.1 MAG: epoxide hydrolase domain-like protein phosphatase [Candidatus Gottesmanbacteria bacterium GW2011_GWB1_43_11]OGG07575.1 MAG: hypothetical protein A2699_04925 [Candidatus Gottesmanbacteria bacterium RIFCSPHIGHO2_01_FULL_43_15]OGG26303.1 MAG: hypothetical protein A3A59_03690 [Candidatus Gottesmanbacteria bacterium RIFCSPLOWO2_01_FULL_42_10]HCM38181.1 hypothetical prot
MVRSTFFDLGGVLFTNGTKRFVAHIVHTYKVDEKKVRNLVDVGRIPTDYREGRITRSEFWQNFRNELQIIKGVDALEKEWIQGYELIQGTRDILFRLKKRYKVYFLSDNVKERVDAIDRKFGFLSWFDGGVFSYEVGVRKPHIAIYKALLKKARLEGRETIFIDDNKIFLPPASKLGIRTILFRNPQQLKNDLKKKGIL